MFRRPVLRQPQALGTARAAMAKSSDAKYRAAQEKRAADASAALGALTSVPEAAARSLRSGGRDIATVRKRKWTHNGVERAAWVADYFDSAGTRRQITFAAKKAADTWLTDTKHDIRRGTHTADAASITVAEAGERWIGRGEVEGLERSTVRQREQHVKLHIKPLLGAVKLSRLTAPMVQDFADKLIATRSQAMARKVLTSLKSLVGEAQRRGLVAQNVAREVKIKSNGRHGERVTIPTKAEIKAMLDAVDERWRPFLVTATFTGMRASELRGLTWADVDVDGKVIHMRQRADAWGVIGNPMSKAGRRDAPMSPMVVNALKESKLRCPTGRLDPVFPNGAGNVESHGNLYHRMFAPLQIKCGLTVDCGRRDEEGRPVLRAKYGLHALRHFAASLFIEQEFTPKRVQSIIGHASITMTHDTYGHLFPSPEDDQAKLAAGELSVVG